MSSDDAETTVNESYAVTIPAAIRERVDVEPGDHLRWIVDDDDRLLAEIVRERYGAAEDLDPIDMGETNAVDATESYDWS
ncbi:MAG: AbrB/MazE/SpoVT family DNA-binding domain-containing protein [Halobacteriales archaeon]